MNSVILIIKSGLLQIIRFLQDTYLFGFIHLGLCVAAISIFTFYATDTEPDYLYAILTGISATAYYNLYALIPGKNKNGDYFPFSSIWRLFLFTSIILITAILFFQLLGKGAEMALIGVCGLFVLWYSGIFRKFLPDVHKSPLLRLFVIAFVFTMLTHTVSLLKSGLILSEMIISGFSRLCFITSLVIAFDLGGYTFDREKGNLSLPVILGHKTTRYIAIILLCISLMTDVYLGWSFVLNLKATISLIITYFFAIWAINMADENRPDSYYLFGIDGLMMLPLVLYKLLRFL